MGKAAALGTGDPLKANGWGAIELSTAIMWIYSNAAAALWENSLAAQH